MREISRIGIDISRTVFQLHAARSDGSVAWRKRVYRSDFVVTMQNIPPCEVAMEACSGSHYWGRELEKMGHKVKLIPPQYVKPFVKRNKNDAADAEGIVEAASRPTMRWIPVKTVEQQELGHLHSARERMVKHRTALVNEIKSFMHEHGILLTCSAKKLYGEYLAKLEVHGERLSNVFKRLMSHLFEQLRNTESVISEYEKELETLHKNNEVSVRLTSIPGVGLMTATAVIAAVGNASHYRSGRDFAASLGVVPRQHSSGQVQRLKGLSKRGNVYIRKTMIQGGHSVVRVAPKAKGRRGEWLRALVQRSGKCKAAVAVANRNARIMWKLIVSGERYDSNYMNSILKEDSNASIEVNVVC
jgi:transposase